MFECSECNRLMMKDRERCKMCRAKQRAKQETKDVGVNL